jgi:hypothetical protein
MNNIYCYVDESGQDTQGDLFSVSVIMVNTVQLRDEGERRLLSVEKRTGKGIAKWTNTNYVRRENYLRAVTNLTGLKNCIFYAIHIDTRDYISSMADTIVRSIRQHVTDRYKATIVIDGLDKETVRGIAKRLKQEGVICRKVRGVKDESSAWIRLADAIAGFSRHAYENKSYALNLYHEMQQRGFLIQL